MFFFGSRSARNRSNLANPTLTICLICEISAPKGTPNYCDASRFSACEEIVKSSGTGLVGSHFYLVENLSDLVEKLLHLVEKVLECTPAKNQLGRSSSRSRGSFFAKKKRLETKPLF